MQCFCVRLDSTVCAGMLTTHDHHCRLSITSCNRHTQPGPAFQQPCGLPGSWCGPGELSPRWQLLGVQAWGCGGECGAVLGGEREVDGTSAGVEGVATVEPYPPADIIQSPAMYLWPYCPRLCACVPPAPDTAWIKTFGEVRAGNRHLGSQTLEARVTQQGQGDWGAPPTPPNRTHGSGPLGPVP